MSRPQNSSLFPYATLFRSAEAAGAKRKRLIECLPDTNPDLSYAYEKDKRHIDGTRHFASDSALYPLCGRGRIKTDPVFADRKSTRLNSSHPSSSYAVFCLK